MYFCTFFGIFILILHKLLYYSQVTKLNKLTKANWFFDISFYIKIIIWIKRFIFLFQFSSVFLSLFLPSFLLSFFLFFLLSIFLSFFTLLYFRIIYLIINSESLISFSSIRILSTWNQFSDSKLKISLFRMLLSLTYNSSSGT